MKNILCDLGGSSQRVAGDEELASRDTAILSVGMSPFASLNFIHIPGVISVHAT